MRIFPLVNRVVFFQHGDKRDIFSVLLPRYGSAKTWYKSLMTIVLYMFRNAGRLKNRANVATGDFAVKGVYWKDTGKHAKPVLLVHIYKYV
jgi:hypothetical protein